MILEVGHPNVPLADWQAFRKECWPSTIKEVIDRSEIKLPDWFVPLARGIAIASDHLLHRAVIVLDRIARTVGAKPNVTFLKSVTWRTKI
jgi:hypothetical protein